MDLDRERKIRERAYAIWLDQGCVDGRDEQHWLEAEKEIVKEEAQAAAKSGDSASTPTPSKGSIPVKRLNASNDE